MLCRQCEETLPGTGCIKNGVCGKTSELVEKRVDSTTVPIRSEYRLTPMSLELMDVVHDLKMWALKWKIDNPACARQDCRICTL